MKEKRNGRLPRHDLFALEISVSGRSASGKSTVVFIIEEALRNAGAAVTVKTDDRNPDAYRATLESRKAMTKGIAILVRENRDQSSSPQQRRRNLEETSHDRDTPNTSHNPKGPSGAGRCTTRMGESGK